MLLVRESMKSRDIFIEERKMIIILSYSWLFLNGEKWDKLIWIQKVRLKKTKEEGDFDGVPLWCS